MSPLYSRRESTSAVRRASRSAFDVLEAASTANPPADPRAPRRAVLLRAALVLLVACFATPAADAFQSGATSPGQLGFGGIGQVTRFDNDFNPAISFAIDGFADYRNPDGDGADGFDFTLRRLDLLGAAWIDPRAYAYFVIAYESEADEIVLDEAAINYVGLPGRSSLKAGRFFVDFGKQMQAHIEELRTIERPLVLREYLGNELPGDGIQYDYWHPVGDATLMRYSFGLFADIAGGGHGHGGEEEEEDSVEAEVHLPDRKDFDELNLTARATGVTEVGERGQLQLGASLRYVPEFAFEFDPSELEETGFSNAVYGIDATYVWYADDGIESWLFGGEYLIQDGDLEAELDDGGTPGDTSDDTLEVLDDRVAGFYAYGEYKWSLLSSVGVQWSSIERPIDGTPDADEYDIYYTHEFSEFLRARLALTFVDDEVEGDDTRLALQLTSFVGPHGHGINF